MKIRHVIMLCVCALSNYAAAQSPGSVDAFYEDATRLYRSGDHSGAIIQLRNALQLSSDHVPSMVLLGNLQLERRQSGDAAQLLEEALLLGADPALAAEPLARAYLQLGDYQRLITRLPLAGMSAPALPGVLAAHAQAQIALGRYEDAESLIQRGLNSGEPSLDLQLAQITLGLRLGRLKSTRRLAATILENHTDDSRVWNAWGSVLHASNEPADAISAYRKSISLEPYNSDARIALVSLLIDTEQIAAAESLLGWMRENIPSDARGAFFAALVAAKQGDPEKEALELSEAAAIFDAVGSDRLSVNPQMQMIGALTYYGQGSYEKALGLVTSYMKSHPQDLGAARLLASTYLALGDANEAVRILSPHRLRNPTDHLTTITLAQALHAAGRPLQAAELLKKLPNIGSGEHAADRALAFALIDSGSKQAGVALLEKVNALQSEQSDDTLVYAVALMRGGAYAEARDTLTQLLSDSDRKPTLLNLFAITLVGEKRLPEAIEVLEELTTSHPDFYPAWSNLAHLLRSTGQLATARSALEKAQELSPDEPRLDYEMALQFIAESDLDEALRFAERAAIADPINPDFASLEVELKLATKDNQGAYDAALRASSHQQAPPAMRRLMASTQAKTGDRDQAIVTLKRAARAADFDSNELHAIAAQQIGLGDFIGAATALEAALKGDPTHHASRIALTQAMIGQGKTDTAIEMASALVSEIPAGAVDHLILAEAYMSANEADKALDAFVRAESLGAGAMATVGRVDALERLGVHDKAFAVLKEYNASGGDNLELMGRYADALMQRAEWQSAVYALETLADKQPFEPYVLNSLATAQLRAGDVDSALATARSALELDRTDPFINDTIGWVLFRSGRPDESLRYLREATTRASTNAEMRYHLAAALHALGRDTEASTELNLALASGTDFPGRDAAALLRKRLEKAE